MRGPGRGGAVFGWGSRAHAASTKGPNAMRDLWVVLSVVMTLGCGADDAPWRPSPLPPPPPSRPSRPSTTLLLSGQSNAVQLRPYLEEAYTAGRVDGFAYGGSSIDWWLRLPPWGPETRYSPWDDLVPTLHQPARAVIWWQGESDAVDPVRNDPSTYADRLGTLLAKIRAEAQDPRLFVIVVQIRENHVLDTSVIREQLALVVSRDPRSVLVPVDDLPAVDSFHLSPEGYRMMAARIIAALPR